MSQQKDLPSYVELFGQLDFKKGDTARSVYSPAAYLADLLQLLEDKFTDTEIGQRRQDIKDLLLNGENTFTLVPYLDIVNGLLEQAIKDDEAKKENPDADPYEILRRAPYPFNLPFNLAHEKVQKYLHFAGVSPERLFKAFAQEMDSDLLAREYLGISPELYKLVTTDLSGDETKLRSYYDLGQKEQWRNLKSVPTFLKVTALSGTELRELLFQNLSQTASNGQGNKERTAAGQLFINAGLDGYAKLDKEEENIVWETTGESDGIPLAWFDRVNRLIRLSRATGISLHNLDLLIRHCANNRLDQVAIRAIAVIKKIADRQEIDLAKACALVSPLKTLGIGDKEEPEDQFNMIFNGRLATVSTSFIPGSEFVPEAYQKFEPLSVDGDLLSDANRKFRDRLGKALHLSENQIQSIVTRYRDRYPEDHAHTCLFDESMPVGLEALSLFFRLATLTELLDISFEELFHLLEVLEKDPAIRSHGRFDILVDTEDVPLDCFRILEGEHVWHLLWLVQHLQSASDWMAKYDFTAEDLRYIQTGVYPDKKQQTTLEQDSLALLDNLYQNFKIVMLGQGQFSGERFDLRASRVIHQALLDDPMSPVSAINNRIVNRDPGKAQSAALRALSNLETFSWKDFAGLGIADQMLEKLYANLIIHRYLSPDGRLQEDQFPENPDGLTLATDFNLLDPAIFELIHKLYLQEVEEAVSFSENDETGPEIEDVEFSVFPTDLEGLDLNATEREELYDNLVFLGYITSDGAVQDVAFFAEKENLDSFESTVNLAPYTGQVYAHIASQINNFETRPLKLKTEDFASLGLNEKDLADLIANLQFNDHLDDDLLVIDKVRLLHLDLNDLELALQFYPQRRAILALLKGKIQAFKDQFYTFSREQFAPVAGEIVARIAYSDLEEHYLGTGKSVGELAEYFNDEANLDSFLLDPYFDATTRPMVFAAARNILNTALQYRLSDSTLRSFDLLEENIAEIKELLREANHLNDDGQIPEERLDFFLTTENALVFELPGYEDDAKDVFFAMQAVAREVQAGVEEIATILDDLAESQETTLLAALQEGLGLDADVLKVICRYIFRHPENLVADFMVPVISAANHEDKIASLPENHKFKHAYRRIHQFAFLANKLKFGVADTEIVFHDQDLVDKFPENLQLPAEVQTIDALLEDENGHIYLFSGNRFWVYESATYNLVEEAQPLSELTRLLAGVEQIDAAFTEANGRTWLLAGDLYLAREAGETTWKKRDKTWGKVHNLIEKEGRITAGFRDREGETFLFSGDQYIRYSDEKGTTYETVDPGYPRRIKDNWPKEFESENLPDSFSEEIDAAFQGPSNEVFLFAGDRFVRSSNYAEEKQINEFWGKVRNNFPEMDRLDAALVFDGQVLLFSGDQVLAYADSLEQEEVFGREGTLRSIKNRLPQLPPAFHDGVQATMPGFDGQTYFFKGDEFATLNAALTEFVGQQPLVDVWGRVRNNIATDGQVDAAFTGLDGKTYLFRGDQFVRYSGRDYTRVDEGYPKTIASHWGGLTQVDAAFVLDGKTYLFGLHGEGAGMYVRYSTNDYTEPDEDYPRLTDDNWWNLPVSLVNEGFDNPDAVFVGLNNQTYLFKGSSFITYDHLSRMWSEPQGTEEAFDSLPFKTVSAAFTGKDGRTYVFSRTRFARYSDRSYQKLDDRYPKKISDHWGIVTNNIARSERVDAALTLRSREEIEREDGTTFLRESEHSYLFSGDQFFRYTGRIWEDGEPVAQNTSYDWVDEGYPRNLRKGLQEEPRFENLKQAISGDLDAAFADRRNVYLFQNDHFLVAAESAYHRYENHQDMPARTAFTHEGIVYIETEEGWVAHNSLEAVESRQKYGLPPLLRDVPAGFQNGLDAVLMGLDKNLYLFKDGQCYNHDLGKVYPLSEEWGRVDNNIYFENRVDAVLNGRDGKIYVFSGDQYVAYTPDPENPDLIPEFVDANPRLISEDWGGLSHVHLAFVLDDKTWLFEKPGDDGYFRFVCYSGDDYSQPDQAEPEVASFDWWEMPVMYQEEGFTQVDAVLVEENNLFLFQGQEFVQYDLKDEVWTHPRPITQIWRDLPMGNQNFEDISCAFRGPDQKTYFFSENHFVAYDEASGSSGQPREVRHRWGLIDNHLVRNNHIDAALVVDGRYTYLFSGEQYVRYSTSGYRFVDEGYPKTIADNLQHEPAFANLPEDFENYYNENIGLEGSFDAAVAHQRSVFLFEGQHLHMVAKTTDAEYPLEHLGQIRNQLLTKNKVDAAYLDAEEAVVILSGDQVFKYSEEHYQHVDEGYPRLLADFLQETGGLNPHGELTPFTYDLDAAFLGQDEQLYLFKEENFWRSGTPANTYPIDQHWGKVHSAFGDPEGTNVPVDGVFQSPAGPTYVFKNGQYLRYTDDSLQYADEGFPRPIKDDWGNLPVDFEAGLDGAFVFEGRTYLVKGDRFVRYSGLDYEAIDRVYPQTFAVKWQPWADFLLSDIEALSRYKGLADAFSGEDITLPDLLNPAGGFQPEPYKALAEIFVWNESEVQWLRRRNTFLVRENPYENRLNLEMVLKMEEVFALAEKTMSYPSLIYDEVWTPLYAPAANGSRQESMKEAAKALYAMLAGANSEADWKVLERQIRDEMNLIRRNALVPYGIHITPGVENSRDLYEHLLIDVDMGSCSDTSRIKEAIAAVQLYFHRYFMNLEELDLKGYDDEEVRNELRQWWRWLKNYRVWEANRKVFLYPENYIRPELRSSKTPGFKTLEDDLLQGEMNEVTVTEAYKRYLNFYTEVSRLKIGGGYVFDDPSSPGDTRLILFGHTQTDPKRWYYRDAIFTNGKTEAAQWHSWLEVDIQIDAERVYPVYAFGRLFVFWIQTEFETEASDETQVTTSEGEGDSQTVTTQSNTYHILSIHYSFYNLNQEWIPAQKMDVTIRKTTPIRQARLFVERSMEMDGTEHENIVVNCRFSFGNGDQEENRAYYLTPELYVKDALRPDFVKAGDEIFAEIFKESIKDENVVMLNTDEDFSDGLWYAFNHKGGSFLCKPAMPRINLAEDALPVKLASNKHRLPKWNKIDAAFHAAGVSYFFNNQKNLYAYWDSEANKLVEKSIRVRWGRESNAITDTGRVSAGFRDGNSLYLFSGREYMAYHNQDELGQSFKLGSGALNLPNWNRIDAAFKDPHGKVHYFNANKKKFVSSSNLRSEKDIKEVWGKTRNVFTEPSQSGQVVIDAAFVHGNNTYIINASDYGRYTGNTYDQMDEGYPKTNTFANILQDLGCTNIDQEKHGTLRVRAAYDAGSTIYFVCTGSGKDSVYEFSGNKVKKGNGKVYQAAFYHNGTTYKFQGTTLEINPDKGKNSKLSIARDINAALKGKDGLVYLFKGSDYIPLDPNLLAVPSVFVSFILNWAGVRPISEKWGLQPNNITKNGRIDAAWQKGNKTFLTSGDEYYRYTNISSGNAPKLLDKGYPKKLSGNNEGLPKWSKIDAIATGLDGTTYFFEGQTFVTSKDLNTRQNTQERWGITNNRFARNGVDAAYVDGKKILLISGNEYIRYSITEGSINWSYDAGYPRSYSLPQPQRFNAAFSLDGFVYFISTNSYIRSTIENPKQLTSGYPKPGRLGAILRELGFRWSTFWWNNLVIHEIYADKNFLHVYTDNHYFRFFINLRELYPIVLPRYLYYGFLPFTGFLDSKDRFQFQWFSPYDAAVLLEVPKLTGEEVTTEQTLLVFRRDEFMEVKGNVPPNLYALNWKASGKISSIWGINTFDASLSLNPADGNKHLVYLFTGDKYFRLNAGQEPNSLPEFKLIHGNWGNLRPELVDGFDAALSSPDGLFFFKGDQYFRYEWTSEEEEKPLPYEVQDARFDIIRLTTSTGYQLNRRLFAGGVDALLSLSSQEIDERPRFSFTESNPYTIQVNSAKVDANALPVNTHLDFMSANGIYYWEMFFHAPFLIAQALNRAQRFEEAKRWYEYLFDPTETTNYWKFIPFLGTDIEAIIESGESYLTELQKDLNVDVKAVRQDGKTNSPWGPRPRMGFDSINALLQDWVPVFLGEHPPEAGTEKELNRLLNQQPLRDDIAKLKRGNTNPNETAQETRANEARVEHLKNKLSELTGIIEKLSYRYDLLKTTEDQIARFYDDPFDPFAIADLRKLAYRKTIVMAYIDNLLDWGDMLFRQYTRESINEARMLYILAYELLGRKPEGLGQKILSEDKSYNELTEKGLYEDLLFLESAEGSSELPRADQGGLTFAGTVHDSVVSPYFYVPENEVFFSYWDRVEDRLYKIRNCLNILGIKQPLPLFQPPIDPLALVKAAAGGGFGQVAIGGAVTVPHYRFDFLVQRAQSLVQKLTQYGGDLLATLEKKDAEELSMLQQRQEGIIMAMMIDVREAAIAEAETTIQSLQESKQNATERVNHYQALIDQGLTPLEIAQMSFMIAAAVSHYVGSALNIASIFGSAAPDSLIGPFIMGVKFGGSNIGQSLSAGAQVAESLGEAFSVTGEALAVGAQFERMAEDWDIQLKMAQSDERMIEAQIQGAQIQKQVAEYELQVLEKEIEHNEAIQTFYKEKFTNKQLYQWMAGRLSGIFYQTYQLAFDMAKAAERAFQFERGQPESSVNFIQGGYWDSQHKGLLAGESLGLDLDRMEQAYIESDARLLEITRKVSLLELDPLAFLNLKNQGVCEFSFDEAFFDYDYPGHYCRQVKTIAITFDIGNNQTVYATLTQLNNKTVLEADPKAVKFLLNPKDQAPTTIRHNWKPLQQIALSHTSDYEKNNGLFELRFDSEKYLPFEGTGAVSTWRLELNGKQGLYNIRDIVDVTIELRYTAVQGGTAFANAVKSMLKPYETVRFFDFVYDFPQEWNEFITGGSDEFEITLNRDQFPNMSSSKVLGIYTHFEVTEPGNQRMTINEDSNLVLQDGKFLDTTGMSISSSGSTWKLTLQGDKSKLKNLQLVVGYKASVS